MNVVVDACSLINLSNAGALSLVCRLKRCRLWVCSGAAGECRAQCALDLITLAASGSLHPVLDATIPAARVLDLLAQNGLGQGETESIAACEALEYVLCSDDGPARKLGVSLLGAHRVTGSIRLLQWCVGENLCDCAMAFGLFGTMRDRGGFLPCTHRDFFCADGPNC